MDISVIICTRNRCEKLVQALNSLEKVAVIDRFEWEVVIVDNGSTDQTAYICKAFVSKVPEKYRYVYEGKKGKSIALNRGVREAKGDILVFTDDDCIVDRFWLQAISREYTSDPELAIIGGRVELYNERDEPISISIVEKKVILLKAEMGLNSKENALRYILGGNGGALIIGCNMAVKKEVFLNVGDFDILLGPGTRAIAEDVDLVYRAYKNGLKGIYFPSIVVYHNHGRQTDSQRDSVDRQYIQGRGAFYCKHILMRDMDILRMAFKDMYSVVKTLTKGVIVRKSFPFHKIYVRLLFCGALYYYKANLSKRRHSNST